MMEMSSLAIFPDEILSIVCQQLGQEREFGTLFNCALATKSLADPALRTMYQYHELSPTFIQSGDVDGRHSGLTFEAKRKQQEQFFRKWTLIWRSIVLSSLDGATTYKPYCRYIRILDFRNLSHMLEDPKFVGGVRKAFFANSLQQFNFVTQEGKRSIVDAVAIINAIGEAVTLKTGLLQEISGHLSSGFLTRWISHSPRLRSLVLFKGDALGSGAGEAISSHCEHFQSLMIKEWLNPDADETFARFLNDMRENTLRDFTMIGSNSLSKLSFRALGRHKSLQDLKLNNLSREAMENLNQLKQCTEIHTLFLEDNLGSTQLEALNNDIFVQVISWLSSCEHLRDITLKKFIDGPAILAQVASAPGVHLTNLSLEGYIVRQPSAAAFHTALAEQKTLRSLSLKGDGEDCSVDDLSIMVESLSHLTNLTELTLKDVSDEFEAGHIMTLALSLPNLEEFWTSGQNISSEVLPVLLQLKKLRTLTMYATTQFKSEDIIWFLQALDHEKQRGFRLFLMAADSQYDLSDAEQDLIQDYIRKNLDGQFDFVLWREAESSDSDSD